MNHEYDSSPHSLRGYDPRSALDGLLPVHPLVLAEVPAILRAATSMMSLMRSRTVRDASADRCVISTVLAAQSSSRSASSHATDRTAHSRPPCRRWLTPEEGPNERIAYGRSCVPTGVNHHRAPLGHGQHAQMKPRHAARVQRPYGQRPAATRTRIRGHARASDRGHARASNP